jgi:hypothetical protein
VDSAKIDVKILKILFDVENTKELKEKHPKSKCDSAMDEAFPRKKDASEAFAKERYSKSVAKEEQPRFPDSLTLAYSYTNY